MSLLPAPVVERPTQSANTAGNSHGALFGRLAKVMDVGVVFLNREREVEFTNPKARRVLGCTEEDAPADCWRPVHSAFEEAIGSAADKREREVLFERGGRPYHVLMEIHAVDEDPCTGYLVFIRDRAAMDQRKDDMQLASQFRNTGRLYRALAHNLRHPVSTILIRIDLLQNMIDGDEPIDAELQSRSLTAIKEEVQELDGTLRMLLEDVAPTGEMEQVFNLCKVLSDLTRLIEPQARQQNVVLDVELPAEEIIVSGQRTQLKQAVMNLAVNALEALPAGGTLRLALTDGDANVHVEVSDDGPGIPDDVRKQIFKTHFTTKQDGTGIGLHLVKETVDHHGGAIDLKTAPDDGCTFRLHLPIQHEA